MSDAELFLRIVEALAWPMAFIAVTSRFIAEWDDNKRRDREARLERVRVQEHLRGQTAVHVAQIQLPPAETLDDRIQRAAVEILRTVVANLGGIPGKESSPGQTSRGIVRELRALAEEVAHPTPAPRSTSEHTHAAGSMSFYDALEDGLLDVDEPDPEDEDDDPDPYAAAIQEGLL